MILLNRKQVLKMYKIGFLPNLNMCDWEPERICAVIREAGYEAIELLSSFMCADTKTDADRKRMINAVEREGLVISEVVLQKDFVVLDEAERKENIAYVIRNIQVLSEVGVDTVNLFTGPQPWLPNPVVVGKHISQGKAWDMVFEAFESIIPVAERCGVRLAVENVWGMLCGDFFTSRYLLDRYPSRYLGVNFDPSHDVLAGNTDMAWLIRQWGDKIFHIHLKDAAGIPQVGKFTFPLLGDGLVNWHDFFTTIDEIGYEDCMSVEFEAFDYYRNILDGKLEEGAKLSRKLVEKLMASARKEQRMP
jgi:L-ribulose-5-phosphate 3-epimerase